MPPARPGGRRARRTATAIRQRGRTFMVPMPRDCAARRPPPPALGASRGDFGGALDGVVEATPCCPAKDRRRLPSRVPGPDTCISDRHTARHAVPVSLSPSLRGSGASGACPSESERVSRQFGRTARRVTGAAEAAGNPPHSSVRQSPGHSLGHSGTTGRAGRQARGSARQIRIGKTLERISEAGAGPSPRSTRACSQDTGALHPTANLSPSRRRYAATLFWGPRGA